LSVPAALRYAWAAPATFVGLAAALAAVLLGARGVLVEGVLEVSGGLCGRAMARLPAELRFSAITLGHVVLGTSPGVLAVVRRHEQAHVRQYERWGLLFFPLYAGASLVAWLSARDPYWHNHFECEARRAAGEEAETVSRPVARTSLRRGG
jgi:hypothetical protein